MRGSFLALLILAASLGNTIAAPMAVTGTAVVRRDSHAFALRALVHTAYAKRGDDNGDGGDGGDDDCANGGHGGDNNDGRLRISHKDFLIAYIFFWQVTATAEMAGRSVTVAQEAITTIAGAAITMATAATAATMTAPTVDTAATTTTVGSKSDIKIFSFLIH